MKRTVAGLFLAVVALVSLVGCTRYSGPATVVDKDYDAAGVRYEYGPCDTKPGTYCYGLHYHSAEWTISVKYTDPQDNKVHHKAFDVDEDEYASVKVGQEVQLQDGDLQL